jgi:VanZ family protein
MKIWFKLHAPTVGYAVLIFILSSLDSLSVPDLGFSLEDKCAHMVEFVILGFLLQRSIYYQYGPRLKGVVLVLILGIGYGGSDEIHQLFVKGREASFGDFLADAIGIIVACLIYQIVRVIRHR